MFDFKSYSRENQDIVVLCLFDGKRKGTYLEIGANQPIIDSNTYLLETEFDWQGVSIEIDINLAAAFNNTRKNKCLCVDATTADYNVIIDTYFETTHVDFLQIDVDPSFNSLKVLKKIDFSRNSFGFVTFEHDMYSGGHKEREESREILSSFGYTRFFSDVSHSNLAFEDWYVNEQAMNSNWKMLQQDRVNMNTAHMPDNVCATIKNILQNFK